MIYLGPESFCQAVLELSKLPGVGEKTAQRLVLFLMRRETEKVSALVTAIADLKTKISFCSKCCGLTDTDPCPICRDVSRDHSVICVVEEPSDLFAIERSGEYRGVYHTLHGTLSPLNGIEPEDLKIQELLARFKDSAPREVILATNPNVEGEATALYLAKLLSNKNIRTTRIAMGVPMGGHLEYIDRVTLGRAISERKAFSSS